MDIHVFSKTELGDVFRVLRTALDPSGEITQSQKDFLETYAKITDFPFPEIPPPITAEQVRIEGKHQRKRLIQLAAMAALLNNPVHRVSVEYVSKLAVVLETTDPILAVLQAVLDGKRMKARLLT